MSYQDHAQRLQKQAEEAHRLWINTLTDEQLEEAIKHGVIEAPKDSHRVGGHSPNQQKDLAESPRCKTESNIAEELDTLPSIIADKFQTSLETATEIATWHEAIVEQTAQQHQAQIIQHIIAGLLSTRNPKLAAAGIAFATELDALNGLNQAEFARENNITRSAVSKCTVYWQRVLGVDPSVHQKSSEACAVYKRNATNDHWRNKKYKLNKLTQYIKKNN